MMEYVIETRELSREYGKLKAVDSLNLAVRPGEIYGFLGLNGAGKTTTIRMLLGMIRPGSGSVSLFGQEVRSGKGDFWNRTGHLVEVPYAYPELTVLENLWVCCRLRSIPLSSIDEVIGQLDLGRYRNVRARNLSLGNAQRLGIARAMIHKPGLLILDEPANGLDPAGIVQIRELLMDLALNHGVTVFVSSHILGEIARFATRIGIIHEGCMIRETHTGELDSERKRELHLRVPDQSKALEVLSTKGISCIARENGDLVTTEEACISHPESIANLLVENKLPPSKLVVQEEELEPYFLRLIHAN